MFTLLIEKVYDVLLLHVAMSKITSQHYHVQHEKNTTAISNRNEEKVVILVNTEAAKHQLTNGLNS